MFDKYYTISTVRCQDNFTAEIAEVAENEEIVRLIADTQGTSFADTQGINFRGLLEFSRATEIQIEDICH